ncbi:unnamed protein product [Durusdinium trenchii]|uniref:Cyclic nucleotide-binding domain-containing protein n=1 Tax=Durusdinium trenchii TaxID=1381693 RepID=A0ABP0N9R9_9DINO
MAFLRPRPSSAGSPAKCLAPRRDERSRPPKVLGPDASRAKHSRLRARRPASAASSLREAHAEEVTPKGRPCEGRLPDLVLLRHPSFAAAEAPTGRTAVPLPGLEELERSRPRFERWSCCPPIPLHPCRPTALRLRQALAEPQADLEVALVGSGTPETRHLLLIWCLACCLELLGFLENAAALFAKCTASDVGNPVHAFNRGVVLLRLGEAPAAARDFDLAVSLCLAAGEPLPALLLARRAQANLQLERLPEVWADFELARRRTWWPQLSVEQLRRRMNSERINSFAGYRNAVLQCAPVAMKSSMRESGQRHWAVEVLAWRLAHPADPFTEVEEASLFDFLRSFPGLTAIEPKTVPWQQLTVHLVPEGQPLFPQSSAIFFLISGTFRVLRFATAVTTGGAGTSAWGARLWATPVLEDESLLKAPSSFSGPLGRQQDGWLVAAMGGAAVLRIPLESFKQLEATPSDAPDERRCAEDRPCADGAPQKAWPPASGAQGAVIPECTSTILYPSAAGF